jgi:hypothetical protein
LNDIAQRLASTQTVVRDMEQNVVTKITLVDDSIASGNLMTHAKLEELTRKVEQLSAASELTARMFRETVPQHSLPNYGATARPAERKRRKPSTHSPRTICTCTNRDAIQTSVNYKYWNFRLAIDQQRFPEHERDCPLYRIDALEISRTQVEIPLGMAWFSRRVILACVELALGTGKPGVSVTLKNIVPQEYDPFYGETRNLCMDFRFRPQKQHSWSKGAIMRRFEEYQHRILSLYKNRKSSPHNRDEEGDSHAAVGSHYYTMDATDIHTD